MANEQTTAAPAWVRLARWVIFAEVVAAVITTAIGAWVSFFDVAAALAWVRDGLLFLVGGFGQGIALGMWMRRG